MAIAMLSINNKAHSHSSHAKPFQVGGEDVGLRKVKPWGSINVPLTMGRSLALDARLFPKGALAFISSRKPNVNEKGKITGWSDFSRFVLNQDTGSAIKGAGRADLFWGSGPDAETLAWRLKHEGDLYVLIKHP